MESDLIINKVISEFYEWYTWTNFEEEHIEVEGKAEKKSLEIESRLSVREVEKKKKLPPRFTWWAIKTIQSNRI